MSEAERSDRRDPGRRPTVEDIRSLAGPSTPHFSLQIRNRIAALVERLPADDPARIEGERQIVAAHRPRQAHRRSAGPRPLDPLRRVR